MNGFALALLATSAAARTVYMSEDTPGNAYDAKYTKSTIETKFRFGRSVNT
jgi:hypothetical protein